jgi:type II secretory pathway component PulJ
MLTVLRDRIRRVTNDDAGVTLIELLVAMVLSTLVGAMTLLTFLGASSASSATGDRMSGTASARTTLQQWQALIQVADAAPAGLTSCSTGATSHRFEWIGMDDILFYANVGNRPTDGSCAAPDMFWLAMRDGTLLQAQYSLGTSGWTLDGCKALSQKPNVTFSSPALFTANRGGALPGVDTGQLWSANGPFGGVDTCSAVPASLAADWVTTLQLASPDDTALDVLKSVTNIGIDFIASDQTGKHTQEFAGVASIYGGTS